MSTEARHFLTYDLEERLVFGGTSETFRARDTRLGRSVALELLPVEAGTDRAFVERFRSELPRIATLDEPHLVPIHDFGFQGGRLYVVMRLVEGEDLSGVLQREGPMPAPRALAVVEQVAEALDALHGAGLVHGDVRTSTVRLTSHDFVYLLNAGLARSVGVTPMSLTVTEGSATDLACVSPERLTGRPVDARSDVYSLACVLVECLTGTRAYVIEDLPSLLYAHLVLDSPRDLPDEVPLELHDVIRRGMAKRPEDRFATAGEFAAAARAALTTGAGVAPPPPADRLRSGRAAVRKAAAGRPGAPWPPLPASRGLRVAAAAVLAVLAALVVLAVVLWSSRGDPEAAANPSDAGATASVPSPQADAGTTEHHEAPETVAAGPAASLAEPQVMRSVRVSPAPHEIVVAPDGRSAYFADPEAGAVFVWDTADQERTATIRIQQGPPQMVSLSPDGDRLYVSVFDEAYSVNAIVAVDTASRRVVWDVPVGRGPYAAETTPDGELLYVPLFDEPHVDVVDTRTGEVVDRVEGAANPHWMAFTENGRTAYTANHFSDVVTVLDLRDNTVLREIPVGDAPHSVEMSPDGTRLAVANYISDEVSIIDTARSAVVETVDVGAGPQDVTYAPDGRHLYTANVDDGTVSVIDTRTSEVTARIATGDSPTSVEALPDGTTALVCNFGEGTVTVLQTAAG